MSRNSRSKKYLPDSVPDQPLCAHEHYLDTVGVIGSSPVAPILTHRSIFMPVPLRTSSRATQITLLRNACPINSLGIVFEYDEVGGFNFK